MINCIVFDIIPPTTDTCKDKAVIIIITLIIINVFTIIATAIIIDIVILFVSSIVRFRHPIVLLE